MNEALKWVIALCFVIGIYVLFFNTVSHEVSQAQQQQHWKNDCRLLETNIDKGLFSPAQNRLQCGDVIENVSKDDYDRVINGNKRITPIAELIEELFGR
ncbi:hypothetical protein [Entomohabitans teleogrylli]|uniref:hypothetical protein n=1 Tax=Entomohabitans teleogrylli TaxID=1384589 RepID=UPI00073DAD87|nr:hypothetical protein [Entomohabitans teleogrylli]